MMYRLFNLKSFDKNLPKTQTQYLNSKIVTKMYIVDCLSISKLKLERSCATVETYKKAHNDSRNANLDY